MYTAITNCRICQCPDLRSIFNLDFQALGSRFPSQDESDPFSAPLHLIRCDNSDCNLLQLEHNTSSDELYLHNYGYRSGLNNTMINHLGALVSEIENKIILKEGDIVVDIGSNDSTLLRSYKNENLIKVGIDPTGTQFKDFYPENVTLIPDFFTAENYTNQFQKKCKVVTTISMFYDLPDPCQFVADIKSILASDGIWVSEQSYAITMLEQNSFDTICHEHLEYYTLKQFQYLAEVCALKIVDVSLNSCNGGSFRISLTHLDNDNLMPNIEAINHVLSLEVDLNIDKLNLFVANCNNLKTQLVTFLQNFKAKGKSIYLYGASTKGNTLLQYYGLDKTLITAAVERNTEKFGRRTPGTNIPIISEAEMRELQPDLLLVLPWHFKDEFLIRETDYLTRGGSILFPLPTFELYSHN